MTPHPVGAERGSAALEFLTLGVLLLVPLVYLVLTLAVLQGAAFAAEGAARQAARMLVLAPDDASGRAAADAAVRSTLADWHLTPAAAVVTTTCSPDPGHCTAPGGEVQVSVQVQAALPLMPPALHIRTAGTVPVSASAVQRVSIFAPVAP